MELTWRNLDRSKRRRPHICYNNMDTDIVKNADKFQKRVLEDCKNLAKRSNMLHKHGCIIVKNGNIVSTGFNQHFTNKKLKECHDTTSWHAEIMAIRKCTKELLCQSDLYIVRIGTGFKYSKPCSICSKKIQQLGIRNVYYSINDS